MRDEQYKRMKEVEEEHQIIIDGLKSEYEERIKDMESNAKEQYVR